MRVSRLSAPGRFSDGGGLHLVIDKSGAKRWVLRTVVRGHRRDMGLGGESENISGSSHRDQPNGSCQFTPPSTTPSSIPPHLQSVSCRDARCLESKLACRLIRITIEFRRPRQLTCQCRQCTLRRSRAWRAFTRPGKSLRVFRNSMTQASISSTAGLQIVLNLFGRGKRGQIVTRTPRISCRNVWKNFGPHGEKALDIIEEHGSREEF
jgi:hypothetical protein